jgi:chemotaxis protein methyltransferase CheR
MPVSASDFQYVRQLVQDDSALPLPDGKEYLVETRLAPLVKRAGLGSVRDLVAQLRTGAPGLRQHVVEALATHETQFFRDLHPFEALREHIIPAYRRAGGVQRLAMWSAASSGGQEAYSLALLMREHFPEMSGVTILATDTSRPVLAQAEAGLFSQLEVNRGLPAALLIKHFDRVGLNWQLRDRVRSLVTFRQLNLDGSLSSVPAMDVVFLRNVLIYFNNEAKSTLLKRVANVLRPGGYLFLGGAETTYGLDDSYERVEVGRSICYRLTTKKGVTGGHDQR